MKFNSVVKATSLISTVVLIIFLCFTNQKEYTRLKILIWNTPSLSLGRYLALSLGTGFTFSYLITTFISKINQSKQKQVLKFKEESKYEETNDYIESTNNSTYDNTLIERDINEPAPTITANFRIIRRSEGSNPDFTNYKNIKNTNSAESQEKNHEESKKYEAVNQLNTIATDWNDESFSSW
tara:strand:+ start:711 stop:1256 length:546 start_codon:yes stop_codon:yes gene_type:complete